jgi:putative acetyltransferase
MSAEPGLAIAIRRAGPDDAEAFAAGFRDEDACSGTLQVPYPSREFWRKRITDLPDGDYLLVAEVEGRVVGHAGIHRAGTSPRRAHVMMMGLTVHREWQGRGVGRALTQALTELADKWLPVMRIELTVYTDNERAIALYRGFGFEIEGTHSGYALRDGRYVDTHTMARVRRKPGIA